MDKKRSFVLYTKIIEVVERLADADAGRLFKDILKYVDAGTLPDAGGAAEIAFFGIKPDLDSNAEKYEEVKQKRAEAGRKGAEKRWQGMANAISANGKTGKAISKMAKMAVDVDVDVDDVSKDTYKKGGEFAAVLAEVPAGMLAAVEAYIEHRKRLKKPLTAHALSLNIKKALQIAGGDPVQAAQVIEQSIERGWQGIFPIDGGKKQNNALADVWRQIEEERKEATM